MSFLEVTELCNVWLIPETCTSVNLNCRTNNKWKSSPYQNCLLISVNLFLNLLTKYSWKQAPPLKPYRRISMLSRQSDWTDPLATRFWQNWSKCCEANLVCWRLLHRPRRIVVMKLKWMLNLKRKPFSPHIIRCKISFQNR